MPVYLWILVTGLLSCATALVGAVTLLLSESKLERILLPLVALSAGSLLGGALFHIFPAVLAEHGLQLWPYVWIFIGFSTFLSLEQFLHWHHCHRGASECKQPVTYLVLLGDSIHNFMEGIAVGGTFMVDVRLGAAAWLAATAHEVPQGLGQFGVLLHGGWSKGRALLFNALSASTFLIGGMTAYALSFQLNVQFLLPFAAGSFVYVAASDLVPQVNRHPGLGTNLVHFGAFAAGAALLLAVRLVAE